MHARMNAEAARILEEAGAVKVVRHNWIAYDLYVPTIKGTLNFNIFPNDADSVVFSIQAQVDPNNGGKEATALLVAMYGDTDVNQFSGKFNIHEWTPEEVLITLGRRLARLMGSEPVA